MATQPTASPTVATPVDRVPTNQFFRAGFLAIAMALASVVLLRLVAGLLFAVDQAFLPLQWTPVILTTVVAGVGATVAYALVDRFTDHPIRNFTGLAAAILVLSLLPLSQFLGEVSTTVFVTLVGMHVLVAGVLVAVLTCRARRF